MCTPMPPSAGGSLPAMDPSGKVVRAMLRPATLVLMGLASAAPLAGKGAQKAWAIAADHGVPIAFHLALALAAAQPRAGLDRLRLGLAISKGLVEAHALGLGRGPGHRARPAPASLHCGGRSESMRHRTT